MRILVTNENEIINCQENLEKVLKYQLKEEKEFSFGFQSGNFRKMANHNGDIWYSTYLIENERKVPRFWNGFGLYENLNENRSNNISIEINISKTAEKAVSGAFVRNENDIELIHRGKLNPGGYKFLDWYRKREDFAENVKTISGGNGKNEDVIIIGKLSNRDFIKQLTNFIRSVILFKSLAKGNTVDLLK
jgi:hypothetical protein